MEVSCLEASWKCLVLPACSIHQGSISCPGRSCPGPAWSCPLPAGSACLDPSLCLDDAGTSAAAVEIDKAQLTVGNHNVADFLALLRPAATGDAGLRFYFSQIMIKHLASRLSVLGPALAGAGGQPCVGSSIHTSFRWGSNALRFVSAFPSLGELTLPSASLLQTGGSYSQPLQNAGPELAPRILPQHQRQQQQLLLQQQPGRSFSSDSLKRRLRAASTRRKAASQPRSLRRPAAAAVRVATPDELSSPSSLPALRWSEDERRGELAETVGHRALIIGRDIEWASILVGFEQANKYTVKDERGDVVAYIAEETPSIGNAIGRQLLSTRRNFVATVLDARGDVILRVRRPFFFINSQMDIEDAAGEKLGEVVQRWHLWQRNYDLYLGKKQFASITGSFLAWEFELKNENGGTLALIDRNFQGFAKELFTDAGKYVIHFGLPANEAADEASVSRQALVDGRAAEATAGSPSPPTQDQQQQQQHPEITMLAKLRTDVSVIPTVTGNQLEVARELKLSERAVALACAITIDFDYFSQHSGRPGLINALPFFPMPMPMPVPIPSGGGVDGPDVDVPPGGPDSGGGSGDGGLSGGDGGLDRDLGGDEFDPGDGGDDGWTLGGFISDVLSDE